MAAQAADAGHSDGGWPTVDDAGHLLRVSYPAVRRVGGAVADLADARRGRADLAALRATARLGDTWGGWQSAAPTRAACEQAMAVVVDGYQRLLAELAAAGELLIHTAQTYEQADRRDGSAAPP